MSKKGGKMSKFTKLLALILAAAMVFSMAACGVTIETGTGETEAAEAEEAAEEDAEAVPAATGDGEIINFYYSTDYKNIAPPIIESFNKEYAGQYQVVGYAIANDEYDDKIKVMMAGGSDAADVLFLRTPAQTNQYIANGALVDLKPYAEKSGVDLTPIAAQLSDITDENGSFYGYPDKGTCWMLFYNKDLFDAKGLPYPDDLTWDEYLDLIAELTYEEDGVQYYGGLNPNWTPNLGAIAAGEYLTDDELEYTKKYCEVLHRAYCEDKSMPGIDEMSSGSFDVNAYFATGNYYTMINGDWDYGLLECDFNWGSASLPIFEGMEEGTSVGQASFFSVPVTAKNPDGGAFFAEYFCTSDAGTVAIAKSGNFPAYPTEAAKAAYKEMVTVEGVENRFDAKIINEQQSYSYYSAVMEAFTGEQQLYLLDEESLDDFIENFKSLREEAMAE